MNISDKGLELIKSFEGFSNEAYQDSIGVWTIGWGTIKYPNGIKVKECDTCTKDEATAFLEYELKSKIEGLNKRLEGIDLTQNQFDSLVSFCYNLGLGNFDISILQKKIKINPNNETIYKYNPNKIVGSCEFTKWVNAGGKPIQGLINRRVKEADYYAQKSPT